MKYAQHSRVRILTGTALVILILSGAAMRGRGQDAHSGRVAEPADDVVRVNTELVQTGVMVFDKKGRFVSDLPREQFELRVDGNIVPLTAFEHVMQRGVDKYDAAANSNAVAAGASASRLAPGRRIIFFIDDLHFSLDSLGRTRAALNYFIEHQMTTRDQVAFISASGQIGFLQQFTNNAAVLRAALARLKHVPDIGGDTDQPPMPEYAAIRILNGDRDAAGIYVDKIIEGFGTRGQTRGLNRNAIFEMVKTRANNIVLGLESVTATSLSSLENLIRATAEQRPERKTIFFISDGFYLDTKNSVSAANNGLQRVTDISTRTGSVIYTIDARGLYTTFADATGTRPFDPQGRLDRATVGEALLSQDGLNALARDTGGRLLTNQNYFERWVGRMLAETSEFYLLAWRLPREQGAGKFARVEVSVIGQPDLTVRLNRGYLTGGAAKTAQRGATPNDKTKAANQEAKAKPDGINTPLLAETAASKTLPLKLSTSYIDVPGKGPVLTSSVQIMTDALAYGGDGKEAALVNLAGIVLNDQGKRTADFRTQLNITPLPSETSSTEGRNVIYNYRTPLAPGLYQIRVAAQDERGKQTGTSMQWIEIPDLGKRRLTLSSLLLDGKTVGGANGGKTGEMPQIQFSVDRTFKRTARLNFWLFIYNAQSATTTSDKAFDLTAQVRVIDDAEHTLVDTTAKSLNTAGIPDMQRIPYIGSFPLQSLPPGQYTLSIHIANRATKSNASQQIDFIIE